MDLTRTSDVQMSGVCEKAMETQGMVSGEDAEKR